MTTGFLYLYYNLWPEAGITARLGTVALLHTLGAFAFVAFLIIHVYMTTTGETLTADLKAMITGWHEMKVEEGEEIA